VKRRSALMFLVYFCASLALPGTSPADEQCDGMYGSGPERFSVATGSPGELGLLKALADAFNAGNDTSMCWRKAGTGESLNLLKEKKVDMIMVHAPAAEKKAVSDGWASKRMLIGSNEFYLVGPPEDPANISSARTAAEAYARIASARSKFFSRGDNSGTHKKEADVWNQAGIKPSGEWYVVTKDFMIATLKRANTERGYFMTDSSTWVAENTNVPDLKILFRGDKFLVNTYHTLCQPPGVTPGAGTAARFIDFVASKKGQEIIRNYGKDAYKEGLYGDAEYARQYDD